MQVLLLFSLIFPLLCFSQEDLSLPEVDGKIQYESIDSVAGASKSVLHNRAKLWIATAFNNAKAVIDIDDEQTGTIVGKGRFSTQAHGTSWNYTATFEFRIKEGKYRLRIYNIISHIEGYSDQALEKNYDRYKKGQNKKFLFKSLGAVHETIKALISNVNSAMQRPDDF